MNNRKLGRTRISCKMIDHEPERVAEVFALLKFVPVRAECLHYLNEIEYVAISERFENVPFGQIVPEYKLTISQDEDGRVNLVEVEQITSEST
jgi:hypothetical protein